MIKKKTIVRLTDNERRKVRYIAEKNGKDTLTDGIVIAINEEYSRLRGGDYK
jgi:hypothetical protein